MFLAVVGLVRIYQSVNQSVSQSVGRSVGQLVIGYVMIWGQFSVIRVSFDEKVGRVIPCCGLKHGRSSEPPYHRDYHRRSPHFRFLCQKVVSGYKQGQRVRVRVGLG